MVFWLNCHTLLPSLWRGVWGRQGSCRGGIPNVPASKMLSYFLPITCQWDLQGLWVFKNHDKYYISESRNVLTCDWMFCLISDRKKMSSAAGLVHTCESKVSPWPGAPRGSVAGQDMAAGGMGGLGGSGKEAAPMWVGWGATTQLRSSTLGNSPSKVEKSFYFSKF